GPDGPALGDPDLRILCLQARGSPRCRPGLRRALPAQPPLRLATAPPDGARRPGRRLAGPVRQRRGHERRHRSLHPQVAPPVHAGHPQLPDGGHRLHRRPASLGLHHRAARPALRRPLPAAGAPPQPHAAGGPPMNAPASLRHQETVALRIGRLLALGLLGVALAVLAGCASRSGGYYKDDGPGRDIPANIDAIPDAVPRIERRCPAYFRPLEVFAVRYMPIAEDQPYRQEGVASWYGCKFHGEKTANGETYDMYAMTAAHPTLPIPSYARVTRVGTGRSVIVRINARGPFHPGRIIDLSYVAAAKLGLIGPGSG